jgi:hypothetical protein
MRVTYSPGGSTVAFAVPFKFYENNDLIVLVDGTTKTLNTDYTVTGAGDDAGGTVTFTTAPASGTELVIYRSTDFTQSTDYVPNDSFPAETHELALDKLTILAQEVNDGVSRSIRIPQSDGTTLAELPAAASRASKYLVFDANGNPTVTSEATISYPEDDVGISASFTSGASAVTFALTVTGATASRIVRVWANDKDATAPTTVPPTYQLFGTTQKYWEFIASNGANSFTLPKATTIEYKVTYEFQGAVFQSELLT